MGRIGLEATTTLVYRIYRFVVESISFFFGTVHGVNYTSVLHTEYVQTRALERSC
jgi:hypothetical protein